jgi:beta-lactamase class D
MKLLVNIFLFLFIAFSSALASQDLTEYFAGTEAACFIIHDIELDKTIHKFESNNQCDKAFSPSTSFLLPLALVAFDSKVIKDDSVFKWDGQPYIDEKWEEDQTIASWVENSVGWVSEEVIKKIGNDRMKIYLTKLNYGNNDISSDSIRFWQDGESLKITPNQQFAFIKDFSNNILPIDKNALDKVRNLFPFVKNGDDKIIGKAGAGKVDNNKKYGWFIGEVTQGKKKYVVVTSLLAPTDYYGKKCPGCKSKEVTKSIVEDLGLFK